MVCQLKDITILLYNILLYYYGLLYNYINYMDIKLPSSSHREVPGRAPPPLPSCQVSFSSSLAEGRRATCGLQTVEDVCHN